MNLRKKPKEGVEVFTDSLNDIMFFLLLFFLIISTMANPNVIKVNLPTSKNNPDVETKQVSIYVTADHRYYVNKTEVTFFELEGRVTEELKGVTAPTLVLRFDKTITAQDIVDVLEIGAKLKVKMVIATAAPNAK